MCPVVPVLADALRIRAQPHDQIRGPGMRHRDEENCRTVRRWEREHGDRADRLLYSRDPYRWALRAPSRGAPTCSALKIVRTSERGRASPSLMSRDRHNLASSRSAPGRGSRRSIPRFTARSCERVASDIPLCQSFSSLLLYTSRQAIGDIVLEERRIGVAGTERRSVIAATVHAPTKASPQIRSRPEFLADDVRCAHEGLGASSGPSPLPAARTGLDREARISAAGSTMSKRVRGEEGFAGLPVECGRSRPHGH